MSDDMTGSRMAIRSALECAGQAGTVIGRPFNHGGVEWTPIVWDDNCGAGVEAPDWILTSDLEPEPMSQEHHVTLSVRSTLAYHETMSALVASAREQFPGPVEAHGVDPKKLAEEHARVVDERNAAVSEMHKMRCAAELKGSAVKPVKVCLNENGTVSVTDETHCCLRTLLKGESLFVAGCLRITAPLTGTLIQVEVVEA